MALELFALSEVGNDSCELTRRAIYCMLQRGSTIGSVLGGLIAATDMQTTYQGSGLKVEISPGEAIVSGHNATQSGYYSRLTSATTKTPAAANASNPRIERLCLVVKDKSYEGAANEVALELIEGTPTSGATLTNLSGVAAAPNSSMTLAYVLIPALATTISNADIKNVASTVTLGVGGTLPLTTGSGSLTLASGQAVEMSTSGATATTPSPTLNAEVEVWCAASSCKVKAAAGIYGDFTNGATEVTLLEHQHLRLRGNGTVWLIVAGEPKREDAYVSHEYTPAELVSGVELSPTRDAWVVVQNQVLAGFSIGGVAFTQTIELGQGFLVPLGQKVKASKPPANPIWLVLLR
jgi:hypothetical protein